MSKTKRISAIVLAVLFVLMMVPFAANAASGYDFTVKCNLPDYTITVYQVAKVNAETGAYEVDSDASNAVKTAVNSNETDTTALFNALKADSVSNYTASGTLNTTASKSQETFNLPNGIYYVVTTPNAKTKTFSNSVVVIDGEAVTLDITGRSKINEGNPEVHKTIVEGTREVSSTTLGSHSSDNTVTFKLTATITGSTTNKLSSYIIRDLMDTTGLSDSDSDLKIKSVTYEDGTTDVAYDKVNPLTGKNKDGVDTNYTFGISVRNSVLNSNEFYGHEKVIVTYTTKLANTAVNKTAYENHDDLYYKNTSDQEDVVDGDTVTVKTYKAQLTKYQANSTTPVKDAKFYLYKEDKSTIVGYGKSKADGSITFYTTEAAAEAQSGSIAYLKKGTYYAKEYEAPEGYNLNSSFVQLDEDNTNYIYSGTAYNTPTKVPKTGEAGTMAFTFAGIGLIVVAGAMFVVVMKKRSTSK